jgi:hypothetical protein
MHDLTVYAKHLDSENRWLLGWDLLVGNAGDDLLIGIGSDLFALESFRAFQAPDFWFYNPHHSKRH